MTDIRAVLAGSAVVVVAFVAAACVVFLVRHAAGSLALIDVPNERSSHRVPTPRGGGLGILAGLIAGLVTYFANFPLGEAAIILVLCAVAIAVVGLIDDRRGVPPLIRLILQFAAAAFVIATTGPVDFPAPVGQGRGWDAISMTATVLWLVAITNFFNFMDGVDALAGGQAVVSSAGIVLAAWSTDATGIGLALAGAALGFLPYNWPPARIFMGDVGSGTLGFLLAGLPLLAPPADRFPAVLVVAIGLTFFIADPVLTLVTRAMKKRPLMKAHREHLYQKLIPPGHQRWETTAVLLFGALLLALAGALGFRERNFLPIAGVLAAVLFGVEFVAARSRGTARA